MSLLLHVRYTNTLFQLYIYIYIYPSSFLCIYSSVSPFKIFGHIFTHMDTQYIFVVLKRLLLSFSCCLSTCYLCNVGYKYMMDVFFLDTDFVFCRFSWFEVKLAEEEDEWMSSLTGYWSGSIRKPRSKSIGGSAFWLSRANITSHFSLYSFRFVVPISLWPTRQGNLFFFFLVILYPCFLCRFELLTSTLEAAMWIYR